MGHIFESFSFANALGQANAFWALVIVFVTSLIGSLHCATMCGGLAMSASGSRTSIFSYHIGRLMGYLLVGVLVGVMGQSLFAHLSDYNIFFVAIILIMFPALFYFLFKNKGSQKHFLQLLKLLRIKNVSNRTTSFVLGLATPLIPCGWLYAFILMAFSTGNVLNSVLLLTSFWLGTVPVLFIFQLGLYKYLPRVKLFPKSILILMLVGFSVYNLTQHFEHSLGNHSIHNTKEKISDHHHHQ